MDKKEKVLIVIESYIKYLQNHKKLDNNRLKDILNLTKQAFLDNLSQGNNSAYKWNRTYVKTIKNKYGRVVSRTNLIYINPLNYGQMWQGNHFNQMMNIWYKKIKSEHIGYREQHAYLSNIRNAKKIIKNDNRLYCISSDNNTPGYIGEPYPHSPLLKWFSNKQAEWDATYKFANCTRKLSYGNNICHIATVNDVLHRIRKIYNYLYANILKDEKKTKQLRLLKKKKDMKIKNKQNRITYLQIHPNIRYIVDAINKNTKSLNKLINIENHYFNNDSNN